MKLRILALVLCLIMLLAACDKNVAEDSDTATEAIATDTVTVDDKKDDGDGKDGGEEPAEEVKTLVDTDTPDKSQKLTLAYEAFDKLNLKYATGALGALYDGDINSRLKYAPDKTATTYNTAKIASPAVITAVKVFCAAGYDRNVGVELQASLDGVEFKTLYTLTSADVEALKNGPVVIEVTDTAKYAYFRVYHKEASGYDLTEVELYGNNNSYANDYFGNFVAVMPVFEAADTLGSKYIYGSKTGDPEGFKLLWDKDDSSRICYYTWDGGTSFNTAKFEKATVIAKVRLYSDNNYTRNEGLQIRASQNGTDWTTLYTVTAEDVAMFQATKVTEIVMPEDGTPYWFIQICHENSKMGYDLNSLDVFTGSKFENAGEGVTPPPVTVKYKKVSATLVEWGDGKGGQETKYIYGDAGAGNVAGLNYVFDGVTDTKYVQYFNYDNAGSYITAKFSEATVISKITLATIWMPERNLGTAIQVSVDGKEWVTLYTVSEADGSFASGANEWKLETLEIAVEDTTAYNYIRAYDTKGNGYCFAEIEIYTIDK